MKLLILVFAVTLTGVGTYFWYFLSQDQEIYVLPDGYVGVVYIFYDQKDGTPSKYEDGNLVFEIPKSGILRKQTSLIEGWQSLPKCFYNKEKQLVEIPYWSLNRYEPEDVDPEVERHVCCLAIGNAGSDGNNRVTYESFYVGTNEEIDKAMEANENVNIYELSKNEPR